MRVHPHDVSTFTTFLPQSRNFQHFCTRAAEKEFAVGGRVVVVVLLFALAGWCLLWLVHCLACWHLGYGGDGWLMACASVVVVHDVDCNELSWVAVLLLVVCCCALVMFFVALVAWLLI